MMGAAVSYDDRDRRRRDFTAGVVRAACGAVTSNPWKGGETLWREAVRLFELVAGGDVDGVEVERELRLAGSAVGAKPSEVEGVLRRARDRAARNPRRGLRDDEAGAAADSRLSPSRGRLASVAPLAAVAPVPTVSAEDLERHRAARAAVWACAVWGPWPEPVLAWLEALGLTQRDAVAAGVRFIPGAAVRALGEEVGERAGLWSSDSRRWHVPVAEGKPPGLWFPAYAPGGDLPERWTWRPAEPVIIGGQRLKTLQTRATPGAGDWPFGCQALEGAAAVVVVEGEKDWLAFVGAAAACDCTSERPGGIRVVGLPGARWRPEWGRIFHGVSRVVVATDCDEAGDNVAPKVLEAARAAGVPEVLRVSPNVVPLPEGGKDWCDALAVASRDDLVAAWRPLPHCLVKSYTLWPSKVLEALGGAAGGYDAEDMGCRYFGAAASLAYDAAAASESGRAVLVRDGWMTPEGKRSGAAGFLVPLYAPCDREPQGWARWTGGAGVVAWTLRQGGTKWPVGLRWPADDVLELDASRRPLVLVPDVKDVLVYAGTAFGLPADDGTLMPLDVVAVGQSWAPGWAAIFEGRPAVLLATPPDASKWPAGKGAAAAVRGAGVPLAVAVLESVNGRSKATTSWAGLVVGDGLRRREVVDLWRAKLREVMR